MRIFHSLAYDISKNKRVTDPSNHDNDEMYKAVLLS